MVNTLTKFGVPTGGGTGRGGILMPKLQYRFRVRVVNFGPLVTGLDLTQQVMTVDKPSIKHDSVQIDSYNSRAWLAGKHTWNPVTLSVRDDVTNSVSRLVGHQVQKQLNHFEQTSDLAGINYKFQMFVETMDGGNDTVLETFELEGCWLTDVKWSPLDYSKSDVQNLDMTIQYDNATQDGGLFEENPQSVPGVTV